MRIPTRVLTLALLLTPCMLVGCDAVESIAGLDDITVSLGSTGSLSVAADSTTRSSGDINISQDIPGSPGIEDIAVLAENVTFTPSDAPRGVAANAATFQFWVLVDDVPAVSGSIEIGDDFTVTDVSSQYTAQYTVAQICSAYAEGACPVSSVLPGGEIDSHVTAALNSGAFSVDLIVQNTSDLQGTLVISALEFDLDL